jgi:predicted nuclease of predicted toxin-antitoxin system
MPEVPILADMNIAPVTVVALREAGWDAVRVSERLPVNATDSEILELARREGRALITQDLDFSALLALGGHNRPSLLTLRLKASDPASISRKLLEILPLVRTRRATGAAITVDDVSVRIRELPMV